MYAPGPGSSTFLSRSHRVLLVNVARGELFSRELATFPKLDLELPTGLPCGPGPSTPSLPRLSCSLLMNCFVVCTRVVEPNGVVGSEALVLTTCFPTESGSLCSPGPGRFSPRGNSAQNFRDWETLLAGAIPLVDADPALDELYDGLPVVAVTNWSVVTPAYLNAVWREMRAREYSWEKLYLPFWLDRVL